MSLQNFAVGGPAAGLHRRVGTSNDGLCYIDACLGWIFVACPLSCSSPCRSRLKLSSRCVCAALAFPEVRSRSKMAVGVAVACLCEADTQPAQGHNGVRLLGPLSQLSVGRYIRKKRLLPKHNIRVFPPAEQVQALLFFFSLLSLLAALWIRCGASVCVLRQGLIRHCLENHPRNHGLC
ncbi:hypothetical protein VTI74DRAFT_2036 [Chaetomium olivicolor]